MEQNHLFSAYAQNLVRTPTSLTRNKNLLKELSRKTSTQFRLSIRTKQNDIYVLPTATQNTERRL